MFDAQHNLWYMYSMIQNQLFPCQKLCVSQFKLEWTYQEVFEFNDTLYQIANSKRNNYDGLIYFISCHGDTGVIYDSSGTKVPLITIFNKFCNHKCFQLRNKPKIYFVEACRGGRRMANHINSMYTSKIASL